MRQYPKPVFDDQIEQRQQAEQAREQRREALRNRVREAFPTITKWADDIREHFPDSRLIWAAEQQYTVGPVPEDVRQQHEKEFGPLVDVSKEK